MAFFHAQPEGLWPFFRLTAFNVPRASVMEYAKCVKNTFLLELMMSKPNIFYYIYINDLLIQLLVIKLIVKGDAR